MRLNRLSARAVATFTKPGRHSDGGGLYLSIGNGGRSWTFLYRNRTTGRPKEMGLGSVAAVPLADARAKAAAARLQLANGVDPLTAKEAQRAAQAASRTFGDFVPDFLKTATTEFRNDKHRAQWESTLRTYAAPLWHLALPTITTEDVAACLRPIWNTKHETARRVRGRIERVLSAAKAAGLREGENPARWKDNLQPIFGRQQKAKRHHPAVPYKDMPALMLELRARKSVSARALEFTILTAARTSEVRGACAAEFDLKAKVWTVPSERMKMKREHRVPLTDRALEIVRELIPKSPAGIVFRGVDRGKPLSDMALLEVLRDLRVGVTVHGFRSSFRDWCGDETHFPRDLAEAALAHKIPDATEAAYRRSDALKRRRELMEAWAKYLGHREQR